MDTAAPRQARPAPEACVSGAAGAAWPAPVSSVWPRPASSTPG